MLRLNRVRKIPAVISLLALTGVSLVACSAADPIAQCERPGGDDAKLVSLGIDASGEAPTSLDLNLPEGDDAAAYTTAEPVFADVAVGDGAALADTEQLLEVDVAFYVPKDLPAIGLSAGDRAGGVSTNAQNPQTGQAQRAVMTEELVLQQYPGLEEALGCATAGSRIVAGLPLSSLGESAQTYLQAGLSEDDSLLAVIDLNAVYPASAWGSHAYNAVTNMPSVVRAPDGRPGISVPDQAAPEDLVVETLLRGDGQEIAEGDRAVLQYTGVLWDTGEVFDSSWDNGTALVWDGNTVEGFSEALVGQKVGSQVLAVIPPELGYGDQENGAVPAGSTLVFVIDIVGVQE